MPKFPGKLRDDDDDNDMMILGLDPLDYVVDCDDFVDL